MHASPPNQTFVTNTALIELSAIRYTHVYMQPTGGLLNTAGSPGMPPWHLYSEPDVYHLGRCLLGY